VVNSVKPSERREKAFRHGKDEHIYCLFKTACGVSVCVKSLPGVCEAMAQLVRDECCSCEMSGSMCHGKAVEGWM
jgi:hypothetical protein